MRRQFQLPEGDEAHLNALGVPWETLVEGGGRWLLVHRRVVPDGYEPKEVMEAYRIEPGYPDTQLDMVYFHPPLRRTDGRAIGALSPQAIDGKEYQRWSRHRTGENPWRPGVDDISTHRSLVQHWLERELAK